MTASNYLDKSAAIIQQLEKGWRNIYKGGNRLVRRDFARVNPEMKAMASGLGGRAGPITMPKTMEHRGAGKFFIEGKSRNVIAASQKKAFGKSTPRINAKASADQSRGANATMNMHEADEMRNFAKGMPQTLIGQKSGHHSYAKILGPESNRFVTAQDSATKKGGRFLSKFRKASGEESRFNEFALKNSKGETPLKYGKGRMNRHYLDAMYKKEVGAPGTTKPELMKYIGKKTKAERTVIHEEARKRNLRKRA